MKRTHFLLLLAMTGVLAALALPHVKPHRPGQPVPPMNGRVTPPPPPAKAGSINLVARPARHAILAGGDDLDVVYELSAPAASDTERLPVDFALVFDRSGSMWGDPLAKAKAAALSLVDRLHPTDRLAIVDFGSESHLALNATAMNEDGKAAARQVISRIEADGGTNTSGALELAQTALLNAGVRERAVRRIVLLSDGKANEGIVGPGLVELARSLGQQKMRVSALGLGLDFDEDMMLAIADAGGGQYRYLRDGDEVAAALTQELSQAASTAASGITLTLVPGDGVEIRDVIGYETAHDGNSTTVGLSDLAAGEIRHVVARVHVGPGVYGRRQLIDGRLAYEDIRQAHQLRGAQAVASVEATSDSRQVASSYDRDAARTGLRARLGGTILGAMRSYDRSGASGASAVLTKGVAELKADAQAIGDGDLMKEVDKEDGAVAGLIATPPAAAMPAKKSLHAYSLELSR